MSIDRADFHLHDAKTLEKAARHCALFLWWAAERELCSPDHEPARIRPAATSYFLEHCDGKLWDDDLNDEGVEFAEAHYDDYLEHLGEYADELGVGSYDVPENEDTERHFFAWLDASLAEWRTTR